MQKRYSKKMLRKLRNEIPIAILIADLLKLLVARFSQLEHCSFLRRADAIHT